MWRRHKKLTEFAAKEKERDAAGAAASGNTVAETNSLSTTGGAAAPTPVAALVSAQVTGSAPPAVACVTPREFEMARRSLTEAVAPTVAPAVVTLVPADAADSTATPTSAADSNDSAATPAAGGEREQGEEAPPPPPPAGVASSPCSPSSPPGVDDKPEEPGDAAAAAASAETADAAVLAADTQSDDVSPAPVAAAVAAPVAKRDAEGFLIDESFTKEQLANATAMATAAAES